MNRLVALTLASLALVPAFAFSQQTPTPTPRATERPTAAPTATPTPKPRLWSAKDVIREPSPALRPPINYCQGGIFEPCVCASDVPRAVRYRPAVRECNGNAGIFLSGAYKGIFSVVVRDTENRDRWPATGINSCTMTEVNAGLAKCSAFKAQETFKVGRGKRQAVVHCLGASGYSDLFRKVVRMTIKLEDDPTSTNDPIARLCLISGRDPLN